MKKITDTELYLAQSLMFEMNVRATLPNARRVIKLIREVFEDE